MHNWFKKRKEKEGWGGTETRPTKLALKIDDKGLNNFPKPSLQSTDVRSLDLKLLKAPGRTHLLSLELGGGKQAVQMHIN